MNDSDHMRDGAGSLLSVPLRTSLFHRLGRGCHCRRDTVGQGYIRKLHVHARDVAGLCWMISQRKRCPGLSACSALMVDMASLYLSATLTTPTYIGYSESPSFGDSEPA